MPVSGKGPASAATDRKERRNPAPAKSARPQSREEREKLAVRQIRRPGLAPLADPRGAAPRAEPLRPERRPVFTPLFVPQDAFCLKALDALPQALSAVMPLNRAHRSDLPDAVRELSALLTSERGGMGRTYWSAPRFVSAYLRYFLPWNLVRLVRLLPGLDLPLLRPDAPRLVDLGSGPLTLPLALWLARPDWRAAPLEVICVDTVPRPMELGRALLEAMAESMGEPLRWKIHLVRAPWQKAAREIRGRTDLLCAGNVLNESREEAGRGENTRADRMNDLAQVAQRLLLPGGRALFVEPGTRLGGSLTAALRDVALEEGFSVLAPCTHAEDCPLLGHRDRGWCHATQSAGGPVWLSRLAKEAKLPKSSLSLAFMFLQRGLDEAEDAEGDGPTLPQGALGPTVKNVPGLIPARVLSEAFSVPGMGLARYACTAEGLAILPHAGALESGALVPCRHPARPRRDGKSGAMELVWMSAEDMGGE